ncbi:hypothetical protein BDK61_1100 [Haloarcula quadrata]|uniref:Uncharacterized protein n=1 Tax=Haloarcula quadrata TaxID=182779 RepID=A0A495R420_9EURY|nr:MULTISPECIES: hypothetical protein [Haloarcula]NHX40411.1 hypothetical protein [Haloarcula sp. R1-2]RKS81806.1 hypothetical protein BDK61_1100 [Haloarcula quadrata]
MNRTRRETLGLVGGLAATVLGGCLAPGAGGDGGATTPTPRNGTDQGTPTDTENETPTRTPNRLPAGVKRVDAPPYDTEEPRCSGDGQNEDYDPLYLCANMPAEPSLAFDQRPARGTVFREEGLQFSPGDDSGGNGKQLYATLLTGPDDVDRLDDERDEIHAFVSETDFERRAVLVVQTGWGSGSILPHLKRIEATDTGIHAFGCYTRPCVYTADYTARTTVARFERPDALDSGVVSLTVDPSTRYNVATGEDVVTIDQSN